MKKQILLKFILLLMLISSCTKDSKDKKYSTNFAPQTNPPPGNTLAPEPFPNFETTYTPYSDPYVQTRWFIWSSKHGYMELYFGEYGDTPVPADYDGDGIIDLAVFRTYTNPNFNGLKASWIILRSSDNLLDVRSYGAVKGDIPVPADYDGDGKADLAVIRPGISPLTDDSWIIYQSGNNEGIIKHFEPYPFMFNFLGVFDYWSNIPAPADYNGDGKAELAVYHPPSGKWFIDGGAPSPITYGYDQDLPVPADYNGDGKAELALYRPIVGTFLIQGQDSYQFGAQTDIPVIGDFDGDGKADYAVFRKYPEFEYHYMQGNISNNHNGYDYEMSAFKDDDDTVRIFSCGSPLYSSPKTLPYTTDSAYYMSSQNALINFTSMTPVAGGACSPGVVKIPSNKNSRCLGNPVYLLYYESSEVCPPQDTDCYANKRGNKINMSYSCDGDNWSFGKTVLSMEHDGISYYDKDMNLINPYGTGHPRPLFLNGKIFLLYYESDNITGGSMGTYLAISDDGENFTKQGIAGPPMVVTNIKYFEKANLFVGNILGAMGDYLFFTKDPANIPDPFLENQYASMRGNFITTRAPQMNCSGGTTLLANGQGIISGSSTIMYGSEWSGTCEGAGRTIDDSEIYSATLQFKNFDNIYCIGNKFSSCTINFKKGIKERTCNNGQWSTFSQCLVN